MRSEPSLLSTSIDRLSGLNKRQVLLVFLCIAASSFFHVYNLGYGEFSNDETIAVNYSVRVMYGFDNPLFFGSLFIYPHPPIRILVNIPFILLFGVSETVMRFPHALFGALAAIPLYLIAVKLYGNKEAILACLLYAVSGVSTINSQSQGVGVYVFFVLLALYYLILFLRDNDLDSEARHLLLLSISLSVATFTYLEAIVFCAPVLYFVLHKKGRAALRNRGIHRASAIYLLGLIVYVLLWWLMPAVAYRLGYINKANAGNFAHIAERGSGLVAFNIVPILIQYIKYNSVFSTVLLVGGTVAGVCFLRREQGFWVTLLYLLAHLLAWTFLLTNIMMHPMYDFPLVALLAAAGLGRLLDILEQRPQFLRRGLVITIGLFFVLSGWHHYVAHKQDSIEFSTQNGCFFGTTNRPIRLGSKAAGYYVRTHSQDVTEQVLIYGTGSAAFYAGRLDKNNDIRGQLGRGEINSSDDLARAVSQSENWTKVKYLIITRDNAVLWNYADEHYLLEVVVTVKGNSSLYIFDASRVANFTPSMTIVSEQYEEQYNQEFGHWRQVVPWFLPMAQERL